MQHGPKAVLCDSITDAEHKGEKMNPEIKADWLTALRSGEYKQGKGFLKNEDGETARYCCLGVLCELAVKAGVIEESEKDEDEFVHSFSSSPPNGGGLSHSSSYLPRGVAEWAGIHYQGKISHGPVETDGWSGAARVRVDLADLNDYKLDFAGIADVIEKEF